MQKFADKIVYNTVEEILKSLAHSVSGMGCTTRICKNNFNKEEFSRNLNSIVELARKFFIFSTDRAAALKLTSVELERYLTTSLPTVPEAPYTRIVSTGISTTLFF